MWPRLAISSALYLGIPTRRLLAQFLPRKRHTISDEINLLQIWSTVVQAVGRRSNVPSSETSLHFDSKLENLSWAAWVPVWVPWHRVPAVEKSSRYMHGRAVKSAGTVFRNTFLLLHHLPVIARPRAVGSCIRGAKLWRLPTRKRRQFPVFSPEIVEIQDFAFLIAFHPRYEDAKITARSIKDPKARMKALLRIVKVKQKGSGGRELRSVNKDGQQRKKRRDAGSKRAAPH